MRMLMKPLTALVIAIGLTFAVTGLAGCKTAGVTYDYPSGGGGGGP